MKKILFIAAALILFLTPSSSMAQDDGTLDPPPISDPPPVGSPGVPVDGGLGLLAAAGVAYGVKRYRDHKRGL